VSLRKKSYFQPGTLTDFILTNWLSGCEENERRKMAMGKNKPLKIGGKIVQH
jgi:hypothetical protein